MTLASKNRDDRDMWVRGFQVLLEAKNQALQVNYSSNNNDNSVVEQTARRSQSQQTAQKMITRGAVRLSGAYDMLSTNIPISGLIQPVELDPTVKISPRPSSIALP